jgi:hypothetical protein
MSVRRQQNWLGQARVDVPHLRAQESAAAADWDGFAGNITAGGLAMVVRGFDIVPSEGAASSLQMRVAGGAIVHPLASESGSVFWVSEDADPEVLNPLTNPRVEGSFTAGTVNYVGIDLRRSADDTTIDTVMFLDALTGTEFPRSVALARTLDFVIVISTIDFSQTPHVCPVAKVTTDANNVVANLAHVVDARQLWFRLGAGGSNPDAQSSFAWPQGRADGLAADGEQFLGGDRGITSDKQWRDAIMTRIWELGGGSRWFSATSDRTLKVAYGQPVLGNGDNFDWDLPNEELDWASLSVVFANGDMDDGIPAYINEIADGTDVVLEDGQCLYVDLDYAHNHTTGDVDHPPLVAQVADLSTLGTPTVPGARLVLIWRVGDQVFARDKAFEIGRSFDVATDSTFGVVKLSYAAGNLSAPLVAPLNADGRIAATATGGNSSAFLGTGNGSGAGGVFNGGTSGNGVTATAFGAAVGVDAFSGTGSGGVAVRGQVFADNGAALQGLAGTTNSAGIIATGGSPATGAGGNGAVFTGGDCAIVAAPGAGIVATGGAGNISDGGIGAQITGGAGADDGGDGIVSTGGAGTGGTGGSGIKGVGGTGTLNINGGIGVEGVGTGDGSGVSGSSGLGSNSAGGRFIGVLAGVVATGFGTGAGGIFTGGNTNGTGLTATGLGTAPGGVFAGGTTSGNGITATGGGTGFGGLFTGGSSGQSGIRAVGGAGGAGGVGGEFQGTDQADGVFTTAGPNGSGAGVNAFGGAASGSRGVKATAGTHASTPGAAVEAVVSEVPVASVGPAKKGVGLHIKTSGSTDNNSVAVVMEHGTGDGFAIFTERITNNDTDLLFGTFVDGGAANTPLIRLDNSQGGIALLRAAPAATAPVTNQLNQRNVPKAWGHVSHIGTVTPLHQLDDGFNVDEVAYSSDGFGFKVTLATPMANDVFDVQVTNQEATLRHYSVHSKDGNGGAGGKAVFSIKVFDSAGNPVAISDSSGFAHLSFTVHGQQ